jgi:hypothetical protein
MLPQFEVYAKAATLGDREMDQVKCMRKDRNGYDVQKRISRIAMLCEPPPGGKAAGQRRVGE